jgi:hypothetical protein
MVQSFPTSIQDSFKERQFIAWAKYMIRANKWLSRFIGNGGENMNKNDRG